MVVDDVAGRLSPEAAMQAPAQRKATQEGAGSAVARDREWRLLDRLVPSIVSAVAPVVLADLRRETGERLSRGHRRGPPARIHTEEPATFARVMGIGLALAGLFLLKQ